MAYNPTYGNYRTRTFSDIFPIYEALKDMRTEGKPAHYVCPETMVSDEDLHLIYTLLLSRYADSHIASSNEQTFPLRLYTMIGSYAPAFLKKLEIQKELTTMSLDNPALFESGTTITNHADHPATVPNTDPSSYLTYIDSQSTSGMKKGKVDGMLYLYAILDTDLYTDFINHFQSLFQKIVIAQEPLYYVSEED